MIRLSIIVPVYNVAEYLCTGLDSIIKQWSDEIEVIAIDDGSTDGSGVVLDQYARRLPTNIALKVIHQDNQGVSVARNVGIASAKGLWITYMDPDDTYVEGAIEYLLKALRSTEADIVHFNSLVVEDQKEVVPLVPAEIAVYDMVDRDQAINAIKSIYPTACNSCYKKESFYGIRFVPGLAKSQDAVYGFACLCRAQKIESHSTKLYKYFQRGNSCVHTVSENRVKGCIDASCYMYNEAIKWKYYSFCKPAIFRKVRVSTIGEAVSLILQFPKGERSKLWKYFFDCLSPIFCQGYVPFLERINYKLAFSLRSPFLVVQLLHKPYMLGRRMVGSKILHGIWLRIR